MMSKKRKSINIKKHLKEFNAKVEDGIFVFVKPLKLSEFCQKINISTNDVIKKAFLSGKMWTVNTYLNEEEIGELCIQNNYDFKIEKEVTFDNFLDTIDLTKESTNLKKRPPIITVMGHVDHGKTTLLDNIRKTNVVDFEKGQITQHIGAYQTKYKDDVITFLDTPGHEAFAQMRSRGATITDIIIIVVSAVDGIKPQTIEAKDHALKSKLPIIVAINKCDLPNADPEKIKKEMMNHDLVAEEFGGNIIFKNISAKTGEGIEELLETIMLVAEINDYQADSDLFAFGNVIESHIDKSFGPVATLLIKTGTLKIKDPIVIGSIFGKVRVMLDYTNKKITQAGPSQPIVVTGLKNVPEIGTKFMAFENEKEAKKLANERLEKKTIDQRFHSFGWTMNDLSKKMKESKLKQLNIILKTKVSGSIQAIQQLINNIEIENTKINLIKSSIGIVSESDILLAKTSNAQIYTFNQKPSTSIISKAKQERVKINSFNVIYDLKESIISTLQSMFDAKIIEETIGEGKVIAIFEIDKLGTIAGTKVTNGVIKKSDFIKVIRDQKVIFNGKIKSLKINKDEVSLAKTGVDVGISITNYNDFKIDDIIQTYEKKEK